MQKNEKIIKQYFRQVKRLLPVFKRQRRTYLEQLHSDVTAYLFLHPETDLKTLQERFGTPEEIAASFLDEMPTEKIIHKFHLWKRVISVMVFSLALVFTLLFLTLYGIIITNHRNANGYIKVITYTEP